MICKKCKKETEKCDSCGLDFEEGEKIECKRREHYCYFCSEELKNE